MRQALPLAFLALAACSKRDEGQAVSAPPPVVHDVTYVFSGPLFEEGTLVACLETKTTSRSDMPAPEAPDGGMAQPCSSFGKRATATCTLGSHRIEYYVALEDDTELHDCVKMGGAWKLDEREMARARLKENRKRLQDVANRLTRE